MTDTCERCEQETDELNDDLVCWDCIELQADIYMDLMKEK